MPKTNILIVYYSMYGHIRKMAAEVKKGVEKVPNVTARIYQVKETLSDDILKAMHAPPKGNDPILNPDELTKADGVLFGIPTRFGSAPTQMKALLDATGSQWLAGSLYGKPAGVFFSSSTQGGGQETTALTFVTQFVHHGMVYVPLGYINRGLMKMDEVHGGSPYGAGTLAGPDNLRQPSSLELSLALTQGESFAKFARALFLGKEDAGNELKLRREEGNDQKDQDLKGINQDFLT